LFAFWDTFQAATPSQALRSWDGAHNGPGRSRFGLRNLLNAVNANIVPVFLLDLSNPTSLSALDFMGVLPEINGLVINRLAILPDVSRYEIPLNLPLSTVSPPLFGLPESPFLYTSGLPIQPGGEYRVLFIPSGSLALPSQTAHSYRWQDRTIIPVPDKMNTLTSNMPTTDGPSLDLRRALVQSALDPQASYYFLGGEFTNTSWGDPACVSPTLHFLSAHPWIKFINADDLLTLPSNSPFPLNPVSTPSNTSLAAVTLSALQNAPPGPITDLAWQTYLSLITPATPELSELRAGYFGIVGHLLVAARWAARPGSITDCSADIDWDGQDECILASPDFFATLEPDSGYVVVAFVRRASGVHQIIAPYGQFVVGLGDPSAWKPGLGFESDPALVPGGFVDKLGPWIFQVQPGQITFTDKDSTQRKIFRLTESGLRVEYGSYLPTTLQIPLGLDPWSRFAIGWGNAYQETALSGGWEWELKPDLYVTITTSRTITSQAFTASRSYLSSPEDPNFDFPAGHFIPFPLALVKINGQDNFYVEIDVH
jgi:hypothetical protein